ncbi:MAG: hypothetical protein QM647_17900 [Asticcacaulis sp.]|uniref:hypothetical protein n=1 Tax=Asticcacaulis sp. TaxID=1872648 RepID=UPI0039E407AE
MTLRLLPALGLTAALGLFLPAMPSQAAPQSCDRQCMNQIVNDLVDSMVRHDPDHLPLAAVYQATENSHPAALGMMTMWRTITKAGKPDFVAIDVPAGQAYIETQVNEGGELSVLWGRIKVVDRQITELELFMNRSRGDHGFSFSAEKLPENLKTWMNPPAGRKKATRAELEELSQSVFATNSTYTIELGENCSFIEAGSHVVDPGLDDVPPPAAPAGSPARDPNAPLGCIFPPNHPTDPQAREIVIDEDLGIVVDAAIVPGTVFPYPFYGHMLSAFIPNEMKEPGVAQQAWFERKLAQGKGGLLKPMPATGDAMHVLQVYDGKLQGLQINVHVGPPDMKSLWVKP